MVDRGRVGIAALGVVAVGAITGTLGVVPAVAADGSYPSWQDVQQAKSNEKAAQAEVDRITALLSTLQAKADDAGRRSQIAAEKALQARAVASTAKARLADLQTAEREAAGKARVSRMRAGLIAAHLARSADGDMSVQLLLDSQHAGDLLNRLSSMQQLSAQTAAIYDQAVADDRAVAAVRDQSKAEAAVLAERQQAADTASAEAQRTASAAAAAVAEQQKSATTLIAQLADLRNTSTRVASQYAAGVAEAKAEAAAKQHAGSGSGSGSSGSGSGSGSSGSGSGSGSGGGTSTSAPNSALAASAVAFARDQIGDPYVFAAAGPNSWDCSGLTMMAYQSVGIGIGGHSATAQYDLARSQGQLVSYADVRVGDLIFYTDGGGDMYHVAIYSGSGMMIEAPYEGADVREVPVRSYQRMPVVARPTI